MRISEFTMVLIQQTGPKQLAVIEKKISLDLDSIQGLIPDSIPSELRAPDGTPIATEACTVILSGAQFTVKKTYAEMVKLWRGENVIVG